MELKIEHVVEDNFTVQDQYGCYLDAQGEQADGKVYLKSHEVVDVVARHVEAQSA